MLWDPSKADRVLPGRKAHFRMKPRLAWKLCFLLPPPSVLVPFLPKWVLLGHELIIASPKSFAVCFLFKYCISHQRESPAIPFPCLVSATGNGDAGQTRGRSQWGDRKRRLEAGWGNTVSFVTILCGLQLLVLEFAQPLEP